MVMTDVDMILAPQQVERLKEAGYRLIKTKKLDSLLKDASLLASLRAFGIDNWDGYSEAWVDAFGEDEEEDWTDDYNAT